jgi:hypothetical protein
MASIDLHCHSNASDGVLAPREVVLRARANGVGVLALTDHDETRGLAEARRSAGECGITLVNGVEISVTWNGHSVHIVGLAIDPGDAALAAGLAKIRESRTERAQRIADALAQAGIEGALEGALAYVANPDLISRTHFARFLVKKAYARDVSSVFKRYLVSGKPGHVPHQWAALADAVTWIRASGGIAVVAHPGRYRLGAQEMLALLGEFKELGGMGIEVLTGNHTPEQSRVFAGLARQFGFLASTGSDFHSPGESRVDLGALPPLDAGLEAVWQSLQELASLA